MSPHTRDAKHHAKAKQRRRLQAQEPPPQRDRRQAQQDRHALSAGPP
jgi:hypothetical protein